MAANSTEQPSRPAALDIKAGSITLPILKLFSADLAVLTGQLQQRLARAPEFFRNAPVIVDLGDIGPGGAALDLAELLALLRRAELGPVGVRGGSEAQQAAAQAAGLALLADIKGEISVATAQPGVPAKPAAASRPAGSTKLIDHPVRSGQRVYAAGGDLIVMAQVSPGAEIMADGNIHIYGSLKGRALAGVQGNLEARIFCSDLQAELVAIGGNYKISENLDVARGTLVQVYLRDEALIVEPLDHPKVF